MTRTQKLARYADIYVNTGNKIISMDSLKNKYKRYYRLNSTSNKLNIILSKTVTD